MYQLVSIVTLIKIDSTLQTQNSEYWNTLGTLEHLTAGSQVVYIKGQAGPAGPPSPPTWRPTR